MNHDQYSQWDAAYVMGVLSVTERHEFDHHMSACSSCRRAVSDLAPLPGLLAALPAAPRQADAAVHAAASDSSSLTALAERARRRTRKTRMLLAAAAVGLVFLGGAAGFVGTQSFGSTTVADAENATVRLDPVGESGVHADLSLSERTWGTRLDWSCAYPAGIAAGHDYVLIVTDIAGTRQVVATWTGDGEPRTTGLSATTSTALAEIARIELSAMPSGILLAAADH
ncbi:anti-sigma factor family protein [Microbacterium sp. PMB16]|uniref:anti-sigma factor family protein n=1 Tax=Microbacterium sp. PMB16 TaxID=3120157 RepID=UPI003F4C06B2